jgi:RNA polymerase sigma factor (sigma-70 family)
MVLSKFLDVPAAVTCSKTPSIDSERDDARARLAEALFRTGLEDRDAFRLVYLLTCNKLFGICLRICGERSAAEDVLGDVYLTVWKRAGAWEPARGSPITWLATIARNRAIDWRRAKGIRGVEVTDIIYDLPDGAPNSETYLLAVESSAQIERSLRGLKPDQESAIRAAFFDGLTYVEIAARKGVPVSTMKSLVRRGLARMRMDLELGDKDAEPPVATTATSPKKEPRVRSAPTQCRL